MGSSLLKPYGFSGFRMSKQQTSALEYYKLAAIHWDRPSAPSPKATSSALAKIGIQHGFFGAATPPPAAMMHARQVHGIDLSEAYPDQPLGNADGVYTRIPRLCIAVKTADCVPLLIADSQRRLAIAVHAGWRGLTAGIIVQAIARAKTLGINPSQLVAAIGPCIRTERFEVGPEVVEALHRPACGLTTTQAALSMVKGYADRWHIDLQTASAFILLNQGLRPECIDVLQICTYSNPEWHSARREGAGFGSNWSWLQL